VTAGDQPSISPDTGEPAAPNYQYWRDEGGKWVEEYAWRKRHRPYYHIQELMLVDYFAHHAPCSVLEFGCGTGRLLQNLVLVPRLEVHGYDQSQAMVDGCQTWATSEWIRDRVRVGAPVGRLPYADGAFDIVYSCEALMHVRPQDLLGILSELLRVARKQLLHLEPAPGEELFFEAHAGCWNHDLVTAYARLGHRCELLPSGFRQQIPYRIALGPEPPRFEWAPLPLTILRRFEIDVLDGLGSRDAEIAKLQASIAEQTGELERLRREAADMTAELKRRREKFEEELALQGRAFEEVAQQLDRRRLTEIERVESLLAERTAFVERANLILGRP
jgi:SAM-dependent methyltransferase